jgi:hypothetical protein
MQNPQVRTLNYPHRTNPDGTIDSICPHCYVTVGTSMWEIDLERLEAAHVCDQNRLDHFGMDHFDKQDFEKQIRKPTQKDFAGSNGGGRRSISFKGPDR